MKRDLSTPASIAIVAGVAVVAGVVVVATWPSNDDSSTATAVIPTSVSTPAPTTSAEPDPGADLEFPKTSGDWTLYDVTFERSPGGLLGGTGQIGYTGTQRAATGTFTVVVYSGGQRVGTMQAAISQAHPKTTTTVTWTSSDPWHTACDGVVFTSA